MSPTSHSSTDLRAYAAVLRRRKWTILLVMMLTVGASVFFSVRQTPMYRSSARVLVRPLNPNQVLQGFSFAVSMDTEAALVTSPKVAGDAAALVDAKGADPSEPGTISTGVALNTNFLDIIYSAADPSDAATWAQAYAQAYVENRLFQAKELYKSAVGGYDERLDQLQGDLEALQIELLDARPADQPPIQTQIDNVNEQIRFAQLQLAQVPIPASDSAQVIAQAQIASAPYTPDYVRNIALAIAAGLALGIGVGFLREQFDDR